MTIDEGHGPPDVIEGLRPDNFYRGPWVARVVLGRSWSSVLNARALGADLPVATRIGRSLYFKGSDLIAWLDAQRESVASESDRAAG